MRYNKVRGIVRAKQGSQIPKFQEPAGPLNLIERLKLALMYGYHEDPNPLNTRPDYGLNYNPNPHITGSNTPSLKLEMPDMLKLDIPETKTTFSNVLGAVGRQTVRNIGNFAKNNSNLVGAGLDMLGNTFNKGITNNKGTDVAFGIADTVSNGLMMVNPMLGLAAKGVTTALKGINNLGGSTTQLFAADLRTIALIGGSYGGSVRDINLAASNAGKKYGLFSTGSRKRADRQITNARLLQNAMIDIADNARDMQAMSGNDLNYINYNFDINGGYDLRYMRAAKSGMKIQDRINFAKLKRIVNNVINLNTKEIEWEPTIEDIVEEFKEGGIIEKTSDWKPIIELFEEWEPEIILEVEEFKDGGKTKEELETPEIEETNQKNLIPEGALHKNKHHMEHTEGLTLKGIPVIDNTGEQQAEIELDEIIFTLEVTKKLEELYKEGTDEAAIEAGKLLVKEILFNTDDRTGLIAKCLEGGKLCQTEK